MKPRFQRPRPQQYTPAAPASRVVTSLTNPLVKDIRALEMRKVRQEAGLFIAEGLKLVADAIEAGWPIRILVHRSGEDKPMLARAVRATRQAGGEVLEVTGEILEKLSRRDNPQTVIGVFEQRLEKLDGLKIAGGEIWIGLDRVRDPGNLGTIIRTADAVGAEGIILVGDTTDPFGIEAVRATMGSIFNIRLAAASSQAFLAWRKGFEGLVVGTHLAGTHDYRDVDYGKGPCLLLMGNEQQGLPDELAKACSHLVKIPMRGQADSLNLAVATGVMLFEIARGQLKLD
ncbi:RNA methyltransferase [Labrys miyagiensis]